MCELLGVSSTKETTINLSLTVLSQRGEKPHLHGDGWGIAFHQDGDVRLIKDIGPAKGSQWVEFIKQQEIHAHDIIAHIRKSTTGKVNYSNTHPFVRELLGVMHSFAHNGTLHGILEDERFKPKHFFPVGQTDSELAFCLLMDQMKICWEEHGGMPPLEARLEVVKNFADRIRPLGPFNFLYSDGSAFFAHGDARHDPLTDKVTWPGLYYVQIDYIKSEDKYNKELKDVISFKLAEDIVTIFASVPLNDGPWVPLNRGEVIAVEKGIIVTGVGQSLSRPNFFASGDEREEKR